MLSKIADCHIYRYPIQGLGPFSGVLFPSIGGMGGTLRVLVPVVGGFFLFGHLLLRRTGLLRARLFASALLPMVGGAFTLRIPGANRDGW